MPLSPRTVPGDRPLLRSTFLDCQPPAAGSVSYFHSGESNQGASAGCVPRRGYRGAGLTLASSTLGSWVFACSPKKAPPPLVAGLLGRKAWVGSSRRGARCVTPSQSDFSPRSCRDACLPGNWPGCNTLVLSDDLYRCGAQPRPGTSGKKPIARPAARVVGPRFECTTRSETLLKGSVKPNGPVPPSPSRFVREADWAGRGRTRIGANTRELMG
jgi:hypothetical protein